MNEDIEILKQAERLMMDATCNSLNPYVRRLWDADRDILLRRIRNRLLEPLEEAA